MTVTFPEPSACESPLGFSISLDTDLPRLDLNNRFRHARQVDTSIAPEAALITSLLQEHSKNPGIRDVTIIRYDDTLRGVGVWKDGKISTASTLPSLFPIAPYFEELGMKPTDQSAIDLYNQGAPSICNLYDAASLEAATVAAALSKNRHSTVFVFDGGLFAIPGVAERTTAILQTHLNEPKITFTKAFHRDGHQAATIEGAATLALLAKPRTS